MNTGMPILIAAICLTVFWSCKPHVDNAAKQYQSAHGSNHSTYSFGFFTGSDNFSFTPATGNGMIIIHTQLKAGELRFFRNEKGLTIDTPGAHVDSMPVTDASKGHTLLMSGKKSSGKVEITYVDR